MATSGTCRAGTVRRRTPRPLSSSLAGARRLAACLGLALKLAVCLTLTLKWSTYVCSDQTIFGALPGNDNLQLHRLDADNLERCTPSSFVGPVADANDITAAVLAPQDELPPPPENPMSADRVRWEHIQRVYELCDRNVSETARRLNMHRRTLQRILAKRSPR